jgi:hypothetical protein
LSVAKIVQVVKTVEIFQIVQIDPLWSVACPLPTGSMLYAFSTTDTAKAEQTTIASRPMPSPSLGHFAPLSFFVILVNQSTYLG